MPEPTQSPFPETTRSLRALLRVCQGTACSIRLRLDVWFPHAVANTLVAAQLSRNLFNHWTMVRVVVKGEITEPTCWRCVQKSPGGPVLEET